MFSDPLPRKDLFFPNMFRFSGAKIERKNRGSRQGYINRVGYKGKG